MSSEKTEKEVLAQSQVTKAMWFTSAAGLIPIPIVDMASITSIQLIMLNKISKIYDIPFSNNVGKSLLTTLVGSIAAVNLGNGIGKSLVKAIPFVGNMVSFVTAPAFAAASTYAIGKIFIQHFESGGTFLTFDPSAVKDHFSALYAEGESLVKKGLTKEKPAASN